MKKPVKIILATLGGLVALLLVLVLANPLWLGPVVKTVVKVAVPGVLKCDVDLASCSINPYTGKVRLEGFALKNPQGYDEPNAVSFESLSVELAMSTLLSQKIVIHDITLEKPFVSYVFDDAGTNNFARILAPFTASAEEKAGETAKADPAEAPKADAAQPEKKGEAKTGPKVVIDRLAINGTKVKYRKVTIPVPVPTLTKIGYGKAAEGDAAAKQEEPQGATLAEAKDVVWDSMKDKITSVSGVADAAVNGAKDAVSNAAGAATDAVSNAAGAATDAVSNAASAAGETAAKAAEAATDAVKDGAKAVGDGLKKLNPFGK